jgi:hypothetical protein
VLVVRIGHDGGGHGREREDDEALLREVVEAHWKEQQNIHTQVCVDRNCGVGL